MVTGPPEGSDAPDPRSVVLELTDEATERPAEVAVSQLDISGEAAETAERASTPLATPAPEGKGPLYKCAICGEFVYESQLDYHVTICPDPNETSPPQLSSPGVEAKHPRRPEEASLVNEAPEKYEDMMVQRESQRLAVSEETQKMWKEWKDSRLAEHHDAMVQRASQKRTQLLHELRKKENQECTFQPKTLPRGSPRTFSRPDMTGEGKWVQRWDQRMKNQRLKQVEADHYAELTLKPKISPFAQAWSQKQAEAGGDGVFERLYHAALQQEEKKNAARRDRDSEAEASPPQGQSPPRRIPTSELLYSDALDRRERLHIMKEQLQRRRFEESKERCAVNNKSRRYYWQLLERQIKAAFEAATNGQPLLAQASLEDFLVGFKCMRPRKNGEVSSEDLDSSRLQMALWRHLDPNKEGQTDLLTMTVFFHVLMGAVDEAAQGASRSAALEETGASPAKSTASEGGSLALQSINEENTAELSQPVQASEVITPLAPGLAPQEEGRRIVELLLRFDPIRLRSEFQPLYTHRMHYQAQQEKSLEKEETVVVVPPAIDAKSRAMADELLKKQKGESGSATHAELLMWRHRKTQEKKEELRSKIRTEEVSGCTFQPKCNPPKLQPKDGHVEILTPAGSTRAEVLYERGLADKKQREQKVRESEKAKTTEEVRGCTFQPNLSKSVKSYTKVHEGQTKVPRGFYETRQRIRAAYEVREKVLQQREDRMARIEATVPYQARSPKSPSRQTPATARGRENRENQERPRQGRRLSYTPPPRSHPPEEAKDIVASGGEGDAEKKSPQEPREEKQPMLYVDVNVTPGQPPERIVLFQGQNISEVAADFAAKHVLSPAMAQKLHDFLLHEVVLKKELHAVK